MLLFSFHLFFLLLPRVARPLGGGVLSTPWSRFGFLALLALLLGCLETYVRCFFIVVLVIWFPGRFVGVAGAGGLLWGFGGPL